jgi:hypothetical protein
MKKLGKKSDAFYGTKNIFFAQLHGMKASLSTGWLF